MTDGEMRDLLAYVTSCWPRQPITDGTAAVWRLELADVEFPVAYAAVRAIYRSGRDFQPTAGHVLGEIAAQTDGAPSFGEAWAMVLAAIRRHGSRDQRLVVAAMTHPAVAELAARLDVRQLGMAPEGALTTWHAQAREQYRAIVAGRQRQVTHHGLPSAAAPQLRGAGDRDPRPAGRAIGALLAGLEPERDRGAA